MQPFRRFLLQRPRFAAGLSFGLSTAIVTHFAWYPNARLNGMVPVLTLAAGLAHAAGGAITGARLIDVTRTPTALHAAMLGAGTSLLALAFFAPAMAAYVSASNAGHTDALGYLALTLFTGLFAFLGAGWGLLLLSAGVGLGLHRLATTAAAA